jgi:hypothetical protein
VDSDYFGSIDLATGCWIAICADYSHAMASIEGVSHEGHMSTIFCFVFLQEKVGLNWPRSQLLVLLSVEQRSAVSMYHVEAETSTVQTNSKHLDSAHHHISQSGIRDNVTSSSPTCRNHQT